MNQNDEDILSKIYYENTVVAIIVMALIAFFGAIIFPERIDSLLKILVPLFIIVASNVRLGFCMYPAMFLFFEKK